MNNDLLLYFDFNAESGGIVPDLTGFNQHGDLNGLGTTTLNSDGDGHTGMAGDRALHFSSTDPLTNLNIFVATSSQSPGAGDWSVSFWYRTDTTNGTFPLVDHAQGANPDAGYEMTADLAGGNLRIGDNNPTSNIALGQGVTLEGDGEWHHVAFSVDRNTEQARVYVDAVETDRFSVSNVNDVTFGELNLGAINNGQFFGTGQIDDYAVFGAALRPVDVAALADRRVSPPGVVVTRPTATQAWQGFFDSTWATIVNWFSAVEPRTNDVVEFDDRASRFSVDAPAVFTSVHGLLFEDETAYTINAGDLDLRESGIEVNGTSVTHVVHSLLTDTIPNSRFPLIPIDTDPGTRLELHGVVNGFNALAKLGGGTLLLNGPNIYTEGSVIFEGTVEVGNGGTSGRLPGDVRNEGTLIFHRADDQTFAGTISGGGRVIKEGTNTLTLSAFNAHTGDNVIRDGTLSVAQSGYLGAGRVRFEGGALGLVDGVSLNPRIFEGTGSGDLRFIVPDNFRPILENGTVLQGPANLVKLGPSELVIRSDSSYTGNTLIQEGGLTVLFSD
ncbi:MAG: LamG-like jellyroll fold domain-containing protein, partial [Verrucomicrobiota bacterium]